MKLFILSAASLSVLALVSSQFVKGTNDLLDTGIDSDKVKQICKNKQVPIDTVTQMRYVIKLGRNLCHRDFHASLNELELILAIEDGAICEESSFNLISGYHFRFINIPEYINGLSGDNGRQIIYRQLHPEPHSYTINLDDNNEPLMIPLAVRHFFLSYALKVSGLCKRAMIINLGSRYPLEEMGKKELSIMNMFTTSNTALSDLLSHNMKDINFDNVLYLPEIEGKSRNIEKSDQESAKKQVYLQVDALKNSALYELMIDCKTNLRPIYWHLIMPVIKLNKLGYDYLGPKLTKEEHEQLESPEMKTWLSVVHICELFHNILLVEKDEQDDDEDEDTKLDINLDLEFEKLGLDDSDYEDDESDSAVYASDSEIYTAETVNNGGIDKAAGEDQGESVSTMVQLKRISDEDIKDLESTGKVSLPGEKPFEWHVPVEPFGDDLWVLGAQELDLELSYKWNHVQPFGWRGFFRKLGSWIKKMLGKLDFNRFASWRKHSLWYQGILNMLTLIVGLTNLSITIVAHVAPAFG